MRRMKAVAAVFGMVIGLGFAGGCAHYVNYPALESDRLAVHDPNVAPVPEVVAKAVRRVVSRSDVEGSFVVNLPEGTDRRVAERIAVDIGDRARLVTPSTDGLPVFHVKRVRVRATSAVVEVLRPMTRVDGGRSHQAVTVQLEKPVFGVWEVVFERAWSVGAAETPELYGWAEDWSGSGD